MRLAFLDIEASGLHPGSFPIEVAWVLEDGVGEAHLIRPEPEWRLWDSNAEAMHGLSRDILAREGRPAAEVALRAAAALRGRHVYSDAVGSDGSWLDQLLDTASVPTVKLRDVHHAYSVACQPLLARLSPPAAPAFSRARYAAARTAAAIVQAAEAAEDDRVRVRHRGSRGRGGAVVDVARDRAPRRRGGRRRGVGATPLA